MVHSAYKIDFELNYTYKYYFRSKTQARMAGVNFGGKSFESAY